MKANYNNLILKQSGYLCHFNIDEWQIVSKFKHDNGIKKIFVEPYGMSVAFIDDKSEGFIYYPVNGNICKIPEFPNTIKGIVWETFKPEKVIHISELIKKYFISINSFIIILSGYL